MFMGPPHVYEKSKRKKNGYDSYIGKGEVNFNLIFEEYSAGEMYELLG